MKGLIFSFSLAITIRNPLSTGVVTSSSDLESSSMVSSYSTEDPLIELATLTWTSSAMLVKASWSACRRPVRTLLRVWPLIVSGVARVREGLSSLELISTNKSITTTRHVSLSLELGSLVWLGENSGGGCFGCLRAPLLRSARRCTLL